MYVRGLSRQDVSDLYGETLGASRRSRSTVSRITQQLNQGFDAWRRRDLSDLKVVYLFLDGQYHAARQGTDEKEGLLCQVHQMRNILAKVPRTPAARGSLSGDLTDVISSRGWQPRRALTICSQFGSGRSRTKQTISLYTGGEKRTKGFCGWTPGRYSSRPGEFRG